MARYPLNLPTQLKQQAEDWAEKQGISLNQFILWAVSEKVTTLEKQLDDPQFPHITYRRGASGDISPVIRGTGIRVQTLVVAHQQWQLSPEQIAQAYDLSKIQVEEALAFYQAHQLEIDTRLQLEIRLEEQAHA